MFTVITYDFYLHYTLGCLEFILAVAVKGPVISNNLVKEAEWKMAARPPSMSLSKIQRFCEDMTVTEPSLNAALRLQVDATSN